MMKFRHRATLAGLPNTFTLKLGFSAEESNETYLGLTDADFRENALRRYVTSQLDHMSSQRTQVTLTHKLEAPGFTLTTVAYRHDLHRTWRKLNHFGGSTIDQVLANPNSARNRLYLGVLRGELDTSSPNEALFIGPNQRDFVSQGIETVLRTSFATGPISHAFEARARYHFDSIARLHTEDAFWMRGGALVNAGAPTVTLVHNLDETHAVALSVSDAMQWGPVTLTPGVRVELINSSSNDRLARSFTPATTNVVLPGIGAHVEGGGEAVVGVDRAVFGREHDVLPGPHEHGEGDGEGVAVGVREHLFDEVLGGRGVVPHLEPLAAFGCGSGVQLGYRRVSNVERYLGERERGEEEHGWSVHATG
jgi:Fe(3+) dicitrate transport protein